MEKQAKISDEILDYVKDKVNSEFNKGLIKIGMENLDLSQYNLNQINKK
jgi:hypothetical protein